MNDMPFQMTWKVWPASGGSDRLVTVRGETFDEFTAHVGYVESYLAEIGLYDQMPGTRPGETVEDVMGYVIAKKKDGEPYLVFYHPNPAMKYKIASVWFEDWHKLPFRPVNKTPVIGQPPEKDVAIQAGVLTEWQGQIVMRQETNRDGTPRMTESGNPVMVFDRVVGYVPNDTSDTTHDDTTDHPEPGTLVEVEGEHGTATGVFQKWEIDGGGQVFYTVRIKSIRAGKVTENDYRVKAERVTVISENELPI